MESTKGGETLRFHVTISLTFAQSCLYLRWNGPKDKGGC